MSCLASLASKTLKPFQGLKRDNTIKLWNLEGASKTLKPFQGLKPYRLTQMKLESHRFKNSETLLGIETTSDLSLIEYLNASKTLKPFQGLKLAFSPDGTMIASGLQKL